MKAVKKLLAAIIAIVMVLSMAMAAFAGDVPADNIEGEATEEAASEGESSEDAALEGESTGESAEDAASEGESAGESSEDADSEGASGEAAENVIPESLFMDEAALAALIEEAQVHTIPLEGVLNARQLGGYVTEDGRHVRENVLLRSGELTNMTEEDMRTLSEVYHVTTIVDLRNAAEVEETPEPEIPGATNIHIALREEMAGLNLKALMGEEEDQDLAFIERIRSGWNPLNEDIYVDVIKTDAGAAGLREIIDLLLTQEEGTAILWHCSGGKDRTSVVAAVILTLLGVDEETILDEFALSNALLADEIEAKVEKSRQYTDDETELDLVRATAMASREYMIRAFDYAKEQSGSLLEFIKQRCNVTEEEIEQLKAKYLTD